MKKIAVFASGGGTDFQSVIDANAKEPFCEITYLVASKPQIGAIARAEKAGIKTLVYEKSAFENKDAFYAFVADTLKENGVEYIVWLAGYPSCLRPLSRSLKTRLSIFTRRLFPPFAVWAITA